MIDANFTDAQIRDAAYYIWLDEGQPQGRDAITPKPSKPKPTRKVAAKPQAKKAAPKRQS